MRILWSLRRSWWGISRYFCVALFGFALYTYTTEYFWVLLSTTDTYWPLALVTSTSPFEVALEYTLSANSSNLTKWTILDTLVLKEGSKSVQLSYEDLVNISDKQWRPDFDPNVQMVYPQAFNISSTVDQLLRNEPIQEAPINGPRFRYLTLSRAVCHPQSLSSHRYNIVIVVKSNIANFNQRQEFRRIYNEYTNTDGRALLGLRVGLVFSVGIPRSQQNNIFKRGKHELRLTISGGNFLNPKDLHRIAVQFEEEQSKFNDLIVGDYEDTYLNLTTKTHYSFTWAATFCRRRRPTILFIDDDVPISVKYLVRVVRTLPRQNRSTFFHGRITGNTRTFRFENGVSIPKWNVLKTEVPWPKYQTYIMGYYILASFEHVERLALAMLFTQKFPVEDAWIGVVAYKVQLLMHPVRELFDWNLILTRMEHNLTAISPWVFNISKMACRRSLILQGVLCVSAFIVLMDTFFSPAHRADMASRNWSLEEPLIWPMTVRQYGSGYEVVLNYQVNSTNATRFTVLGQFVSRRWAKGMSLRFEDLMQIPDHLWRRPVHPQVYKTYPQAINISDTVDRLLRDRPIEEAPINNVVFRYLVVGKSVCHPDIAASQNYDVVVMVKSSVANFEAREHIRQVFRANSAHWERLHLGLRFGLVFSIGLRSSRQNVLQRGNTAFQLNSDEKTANRISHLLKEELTNNDDLILGEYEDNYFNLTLKMQYSYSWIATFCRRSRPTVLFLDDDGVFVGMDLAKTLIRLLPRGKDRLLHGKIVRRGRVYRYDRPGLEKWGVSKSEVPWPEYPTYPYGIYVLMSYSNIQRLALGMLFTKPYHIDDSWLGLVATRMGMHFRNIPHLASKVRLLRATKDALGPIDWQWSA
ncbi:unnamed protein product [Hydatigera taeniaeformis]|uniref:Hexosyltransferase n=1 Tax=Hydatigena taeniaeformis TaxID=6205 RepID=A0A0R3WI48_HYDTA|nr:unnamed protein product [Hydatigera taeniaeformis]